LNPRARKLLDDLNQYSSGFSPSKPLFCKLCSERIIDLMPLILGNHDQSLCMSFHFTCALKGGIIDDFNSFASNLNYIYKIGNDVHPERKIS